jgi:predicted RNA-binding protein Jag
VLRAVDVDERPAILKVSALMNVAKEKIKLSFNTQNKATLLKKSMDIIERQWVSQMDHPLYGAALYLNPKKISEIQKKGDDRTVAELRSYFNDVLIRMEPNAEIQTKIDEYTILYEDQ